MFRPLFRRFFSRNVTPQSLAALRDAYIRQWDESHLWQARLDGRTTTYPFLTQDSWLFTTSDIDRLVRESDQSVAHLPVDRLFLLMVRLMLRVWNGGHYFLTGFTREQDHPTLFAAPGTFFQYISECKKKEQAAARMSAGDPLPSLWPSAPTDDLITARSEAAGIGCGVTIVGPRSSDGGRPVILQQRSAATIGHVGSWSVAPTFVFQPFANRPTDENLALSRHVYREVAEEFYGIPEPTDKSQVAEPDLIRRLRLSVESSQSQLRCVGFGLDGTNLEPNVALLLEIRDARLFDDIVESIQGSWENDRIGVYSTRSEFVIDRLHGLRFTCGSAFCLTRSLALLASEEDGQQDGDGDDA